MSMKNIASSRPPDYNAIKTVVTCDPGWSYEYFQSFYMQRDPRRIKPNVVVFQPNDTEVYFQTNEYGFKGTEVQPWKKQVVFWGDSVVFAIGRGWIEGLERDFPAYQFQNGGLEGDDIRNIFSRALEMNQQLEISHNIVIPGWPRLSADKVYPVLQDMARQLPGAVFVTVPTSLNVEIARNDLRPYFRPGDHNEGYNYCWGEYTIEKTIALEREFRIINSMMTQIGRKEGIPVIDWYQAFYAKTIDIARELFFDVGHTRPCKYPQVREFFSRELKNVLE
jgi:hypothetical protein